MYIFTSFWHNSYCLGNDFEHIHSYSLSSVGKPCLSPIENESRCIKASEVLIKSQQNVIELTNSFKIFPYVRPSGNGYDLPKGCIVQMDDELFSMNSDTGGMEVAPNCNMTCQPPNCMCHRFVFPRFVYWNPNGAAISNDKYIRTLCYNPHKAMAGINMLSKYQKYLNARNNCSFHIS